MLAIKYSFEENKIYCGDNIVVLKDFPPECVDLIYIDPPFFSNRNYEIVFNDGYELEVFGDRWQGGINHYIEWMRERIRELHRVLKPTGSFYLHCDKFAVHYLKVLCDEIFDYKNFRNDIIWHYSGTGRPKKKYKAKHDNILFYTKSNTYTFNVETIPVKPNSIAKYDKRDKDGRKYKTYNNPDGSIRKSYMNEQPIDDVWEIPIINAMAKERLGYPTQKPETLLERIIRVSSNEGDVIMDSFCGCGTSLSVARKLGRRFVGIDVSPLGCVQTAKRINYPIRDIVGMKYTEEELKQLDPYIFQEWVCEMLGGVSNTKKTADGGIDGWIKNLPIEVKNHSIGRPYVQKFESAMRSKKAKKGIIAGIGISKNAVEEVARAKRDDNLEIILVNVVDLTSPSYKGLDVEMGSLII